MGNIYPFGQTCQYLVSRAARRRHAGKYAQALALLTKAKDQYGENEEIEFEFASVYDEMGNEDAAVRSYLRVVRLGGHFSAQALFRLSLTFAQRADLMRAASYFDAFWASDRSGVSLEMAELLKRQLFEAICPQQGKSKKARAAERERRAVALLHAGKFHAAKRCALHSLALEENAQRHLLMACIHLVLSQFDEAIRHAEIALEAKSSGIQAQCLIADALYASSRNEEAKKALFKAARRARSSDSLFNAAIECSKHGENELTLILTKRLLRRDPHHLQAMRLRACALMNLGMRAQAARLFSRISALNPEDDIISVYCRLSREEEEMPSLSMAQDLPPKEAVQRSMQLVSVLNEEPELIRADSEAIRTVCTNARWAIYSPMAGENVKYIAVIVLSALDTQETRSVLFDALMDPSLGDHVKKSILHAVTAHGSEQPAYADLDGRLVRPAAGASVPGGSEDAAGQEIVQLAANQLLRHYPHAAQRLLTLWVAYYRAFGPAQRRLIPVLAAALEYAFHASQGRAVDPAVIAGRYGISARLCMVHARRILRAQDQAENNINSLIE